MSTELDIFLYSIRDVEGTILGLSAFSLLYWYHYCGNPITEIYMKKDMSNIRVSLLVNSDGNIKNTYVSRSDIVPVQFDRIQAMQPIVVKTRGKEQIIGHFPITDKVELSNPLAFELIFGPSAYNSFQYFQVN